MTGDEYLRARWHRLGYAALLGVNPALEGTGQPYSCAKDTPVN